MVLWFCGWKLGGRGDGDGMGQIEQEGYYEGKGEGKRGERAV